jgi:membrane-bound lytic murein transglycosylase C
MKKLLLCLMLVTTFNVVLADDFNDFKQKSMSGFDSQKQEFASYKREVNKAFETYKDIVEEEFEAYKKSISKYWDTTEVSTSTKWVEYINHYRVRKTVDFEDLKIKIDISEGSSADIKPVLVDLLKEDRGDAFRRDIVSFNTEKRLKKEVPEALSAKVSGEPVIAPFFTDKKMTDKEINQLAAKLAKSAKVSKEKSVKTGKPYVSATINLPADSYVKAAKKVTGHVGKYSTKFKLKTSLVMSVIYNESRFNPLAKSYVPAYGLMQIVPKSAGLDATKFLFGKSKILSPSYLYTPEKNIQIGTAYLHLLYNRYFKGVKDPVSRLYCSIAAYNTGAGNVAYAFTRTYSVNKALPIINRMSASQVYDQMRKKLRYQEARNYIVKVTGKMKDY